MSFGLCGRVEARVPVVSSASDSRGQGPFAAINPASVQGLP